MSTVCAMAFALRTKNAPRFSSDELNKLESVTTCVMYLFVLFLIKTYSSAETALAPLCLGGGRSSSRLSYVSPV